MKYSVLTIILCCLTLLANAQDNSPSKKVDYKGFMELTDSLRPYRESRLISPQTFLKYSRDVKTVILDTRSKNAFDEIHVDGAIHLNFSDFTAEKLAKIIPDKETRILIYCNNNFESKLPSLQNKGVTLALNIPTFINLYGSGYKNIYELDGDIVEEESVIPLERNF